MTNREYLEDQDAEEPDDFIISLTAQVSTIFFSRTNMHTSQKACTLCSWPCRNICTQFSLAINGCI